MRYIFFILFLFALFCPGHSVAQSPASITVSVQDVSFENFVTTIEKETSCYFYYDVKETDSFKVTINAVNMSLQQLLEKVFANTRFHFAIDNESGRVFISRQQAIATWLPKSLFAKNLLVTDSLTSDLFTLVSEIAVKDKIIVSEENKVFEIGIRNSNNSQVKATITGYIRDKRNGEAIAGASIVVDSSSAFAVTDQFGYYAITIPKGKHQLIISSTGMTDTRRNIVLNSGGKLNIDLQEYIPILKAVIVQSEKKSNLKNLQMGAAQLSIKTIKQVPVVFGEADILKVVLALPGVTSVGEASNGFNVRGGSTDQNLILFNDATVYNPSHLFGFFSAFNSDVVKGIELYKSAIPEKYGGRLSSVLDITMKDGNTKNWTGTGGLGLLTSHFTVEGPLKKEKTSIILGGRTTYSNWLLHKLKNVAYRQSNAFFGDFNVHLTHTVNSKNTLYLTGYYSTDNFSLNNDTAYKYSNRNVNIKWKHLFNNNFYGIITAGVDGYSYSVSSKSVPVNAYDLSFGIKQTSIHSIFNYKPNNKHTVNFGLNSIYYNLQPSSFVPAHPQSLVIKTTLQKERALESALFAGDQITLNSKLSISAGVRLSMFNFLGARDVYNYKPGLPRSINTIIDTANYAAGSNIKTYIKPEVRLSLRYSLSDNASVKLSYNTLVQYIHMLSNTTSISPTDIWKLSDTYIKPQTGDQFSVGFYKNLQSNTIETSLELYYKRMNGFVDYKSGASLLLNSHIETDIVNSKGKAYGIELLIKKTSGRVNGWISYSYSRTFLKTDDPLAGVPVNSGKYYPAAFDKPHSINLIGNYRFSHRYSLSANFVYSTGRPITLPLALFNIGGATSLYYSQRNQYRIPDYMRTDISVTMDGNHKVKQRFHNSWSLGVYNLLARQNAYSVYFTNANGTVKGYQLSIFGSAIPFVTYNIRF
jgi:CarboxypepD_reg-like domain/TonB-dependent Receptor Plug Domain